MGTNNFHCVNASRIFAVEIEEDFDLQDLKENLRASLTGFEFKYLPKDPNELRNFPSSVITTTYINRKYSNFDCNVYIDVVIRSGYYSGVNLDYNFRYEIECQEFEYYEDFAYVIEYQTNTSIRNAERIAKYVKHWIDKTKSKLVKEVETVFEQFSIPLKVKGRFSNGETIYEKV